MSDATAMPNLNYFQWSLPTAENPRLAAPISDTATTITFTNPPKDEDGVVITGNFLMGISDKNGYVESVFVPAAGMSADGLTATSVIRGVDLKGLDFNTQNTSTNAVAHDQDDAVTGQISGVNFSLMIGALQGTIASGGTSWQIGDETDVDVTVFAANGDANLPFFRYVAATNDWNFSNDGVSSTPFGTGAGVTGGDGITVTAGDIDIDTTDTTIFVKTSSGAGDEDKAIVLDAAGTISDSGFYDGNLQAIVSTGTTDVTATELETLSDGSDAGALHWHGVTTDRQRAATSNRLLMSLSNAATKTFTAVTVTNVGGYFTVATPTTENQGGGIRVSQPVGTLEAKNPSFVTTVKFNFSTAQDGFIGVVDPNIAGTSFEDNVMTLDHFGFLIADGQIAISVADGSTQSVTNVSGTVTDLNNFSATFDGVTATFFINGTNVGTRTSNVPDGTLTDLTVVLVADATAAQKTMSVMHDGSFEIDRS